MKIGDRCVLTAAIDIGRTGPCGTVIATAWRKLQGDSTCHIWFDGANRWEIMPQDAVRVIPRQPHPDPNGEVR